MGGRQIPALVRLLGGSGERIKSDYRIL